MRGTTDTHSSIQSTEWVISRKNTKRIIWSWMGIGYITDRSLVSSDFFFLQLISFCPFLDSFLEFYHSFCVLINHLCRILLFDIFQGIFKPSTLLSFQSYLLRGFGDVFSHFLFIDPLLSFNHSLDCAWPKFFGLIGKMIYSKIRSFL